MIQPTFMETLKPELEGSGQPHLSHLEKYLIAEISRSQAGDYCEATKTS